MSCPQDGKCRVNNKKNATCFCHLGEKFWFGEIKESHWTQKNDPELERRKKDGHVGLKNLGATCYVNTFIQLWFNNINFRSAINNWRIKDGESYQHNVISVDEVSPKSIALDNGNNPSVSICGYLQYVFALLQFSERKYIDPSCLIQSLGLQANEQQDAQEFSKLFISVLGDSLSNQTSKNIIEDQFGGKYKYQTKCHTCESISERAATFYELDLHIKGHLKLRKCLQEFFKEEILEGDNLYHCTSCQSKQKATRKIVLEKLPPVLNLQLLRFVFDRQTGTKKKLNSLTQFPDVLDMNEFIHFPDPQDGMYDLNAVLIHRGLSAHSGHYIAHILDKRKNVWCRYNDELVEEMKGKTLQLGKEDDLETNGEKKQKKSKTKDDGHSSKNAYMLVYRKRGTESNMIAEIPDRLKEIVALDNSLLEEWINEKKVERNSAIEAGESKRKTITEIYSLLRPADGMDFEYISSEWLRQWLKPDLTTVPPVDNTALMCEHSKVSPYKETQMKRISIMAANKLFDQYGGLPRFKSDSLCSICSSVQTNENKFNTKLASDLKIIGKATKNNKLTKGFWVGKKSLRSFKKLATEAYELRNGIVTSTTKQKIDASKKFTNNGNNSEINENLNVVNNSPDNTNDTNNNNNNNNNHSTSKSSIDSSFINVTMKFSFNDDVQCETHGNLSLSSNSRCLVSEDVWQKCMEYFPDAAVFSSDTIGCKECQKEYSNSQEEIETLKFLANEQKQALSFLNRNPTIAWKQFTEQDSTIVHILTMSFVTEWRKKIKGSSKSRLLGCVDNSEIFCEHDLLLYTAEELVDQACLKDPEIFLITDPEYNILKEYLECPNDVLLIKETIIKENMNSNKDKQTASIDSPANIEDRGTVALERETNTVYQISPDFCSECRKIRLLSEGSESEDYTSAAIYVLKRSREDAVDLILGKGRKGSTTDDGGTVDVNGPPKKKKKSEEGNTRRSSRNRTKRGEYMVRVDASQTLKQLKIQLLHIYSILPIEQNLSFEDGTPLIEDSKTLNELGVFPGTHLILTVDEVPADGAIEFQESVSDKSRTKEEGFKGTNLMCRGIS